MGFKIKTIFAAPYGPWAAAGGVATNETYQPSALTSDTQFIREVTSTDGALDMYG